MKRSLRMGRVDEVIDDRYIYLNFKYFLKPLEFGLLNEKITL